MSSSSVPCLGFTIFFRTEEYYSIFAGEEGVRLKERRNGVSPLEMEANDSLEVHDDASSTTFFFLAITNLEFIF